MKAFLVSKEDEISHELQAALKSLAIFLTQFEIEMFLHGTEEEKQGNNRILYLLEEIEKAYLPYTPHGMNQMKELLEKLFASLELIETMKEIKTGAGVTQYRPCPLKK